MSTEAGELQVASNALGGGGLTAFAGSSYGVVVDAPSSFLLLPAGGEESGAHFATSVAAPIDSGRLDAWLEPSLAGRVRGRITNRLAIWGLRDNTKALPGSGVQPIIWDRISAGTLALFSDHDRYFCRGSVIAKARHDGAASAELWSSPEFHWLIFLTDLEEIDIPLNVVRRAAGFREEYKLNRQALVPRAHREAALWTALAPFLEAAAAELVAATVRRNALDTSEPAAAPAFHDSEQPAPTVIPIAPEVARVESFDIRSVAALRTAERREGKLVERLITWWKTRDGWDAVYRHEIRPEVGARPLFTDLFNRVTNQLVEAKGTAEREDIRMAIGQLVDYARFVSPAPELYVLLPELPSHDLRDLLATAGIGLILPSSDGFAELAPGPLASTD